MPEATQELARLIPELPPAALEALSADTRLVTAKPGETVVGRGERQRVGILTSGLLWLAIRSADGRTGTIRYYEPGQTYGLISLYHPMPGTLVAIRTSTLVRLPAEKLLGLSTKHVEVSVFLTEAMAAAALELAAAAEEFAFLSVTQRVVKHVQRLAEADPGSGDQLVARVTQQQLADAVGSAREVVARTLHQLGAAGLIELSRGEVVIKNLAALNRWVEG